MRTRFDEQLTMLNNSLIEMGALIENAIALAAKALTERDAELARKTIDCDKEINDIEKNIERLCLKLILHQHPVASDLRLISTALKMITDMERIGDHATDISEITIFLSKAEYVIELKNIPQMAKETIKMVSDSIDAYVKKDLALAQSVITHDDIVDELFCKVRADLLALICEDVNNGELAMDFLMIAKYFERIGDHAVNIAEWVIFSITGQHKDEKIM